MKVLVLGGKGFIGRNIAQNLRANGVYVEISSRKLVDDQSVIRLQMQEMIGMSNWLPVIADFDVVINAIGIMRERTGETYESVQTIAPQALALACAQLGIRLIHISAIGLNLKARSRFIRSKYLGEQAILRSNANVVIARVSLLDGQGGYGAKWFRRVATWPLQFVMQSNGLIAPLHVADLGEAIANLVINNLDTPSIIELGGSEIVSIPDYLQLLRIRYGKNKAIQISAPKWMVRLVSHVFDVLAWTPLSFGHFELMQTYNVPAKNSLPDLLGRPPRLVGENKQLPNEVSNFQPIAG